MKISQYTEREIDRNIKIIEKDIKRAEKNKEETLEARVDFERRIKSIDESVIHYKAYINEQKQKMQFWETEKRKVEEQWSKKKRLGF